MAIGTPVSLGTSAGALTLTLTTTAAVAAGESIVVHAWVANTRTFTSVTDSAGNTYTQDQTVGSNPHMAVWSCHNAIALPSGSTITANLSSGTTAARGISAMKVSGLATTGALDQHTSASGSTAAWSVGPTGTLAQAAELAVYAVADNAAGTANTPDGSWVDVNDFATLGTADARMAMGYRIVSATTALTASGTMGAEAWTAIIATYKAASAQTIAFGQASEADSAQTLTPRKRAAAGQSSETDSAQTLTPRKRAPIAQSAETDVAQPLVPAKRTSAGQAVEADSAGALTAAKRAATGAAAETDQAGAFTAAKGVSLPSVVETDAALPFAAGKRVTLGQATETDSAGGFTVRAPGLNQAVEQDAAQPFSAARRLAMGVAAETDSAGALAPAKAAQADTAQHDDTAGAFRAVKVVRLGQAIDSSEAPSLTPAHAVALGQAVEVDTARAFGIDAFTAPPGYPGVVATDKGGSLRGVTSGHVEHPAAGGAR